MTTRREHSQHKEKHTHKDFPHRVRSVQQDCGVMYSLALKLKLHGLSLLAN
jgi:hypothetical protein